MQSSKTLMRFHPLHALRELGPGPLARYAMYRIALRSGGLRRRTPSFAWEDRPLEWWLRNHIPSGPIGYTQYRETHAQHFFFRDVERVGISLQSILGEDVQALVAEADSVLNGRYRLFGQPEIALGNPPNWSTFALTTSRSEKPVVDLERHWTEYAPSELPLDVKLLWEISRFGWAYSLARAYALTGDERYVDGFFILLRSWREANAPNNGLNWHSGQEIAIRLLALVFSFFTFNQALGERGGDLVDLATMIAVHADRIPATLLYARAQDNNHLLVEALALYTTGVLFPEFRDAGMWKRSGRKFMVRALKGQVFLDGGYIQHSTNYHRLALQAGIWGMRLAELEGNPLSETSVDAVRRMTSWLAALVDPATGNAPNWGPNDGALLLPLSICPFGDYRPTLQAAALTVSGVSMFPRGPWDELALWLGVADACDNKSRVADDAPRDESKLKEGISLRYDAGGDQGSVHPDHFHQSGIYIMRGQRSRGVMRAAQFHSRPGHSDQLHFDLWRGGINLARDPGTYLYNAEHPWDNVFTGAWCHNTALIDGCEPMLRAGRFLWLGWSKARLLGHWRAKDGRIEILSALHQYRSRENTVHQRTILRVEDRLWIVVDDILGIGEAEVRIGWNLPDIPFEIDERTQRVNLHGAKVSIRSEGIQDRYAMYRAGELIAGEEFVSDSSTYGWFAPTYALKQPALLWLRSSHAPLPMRGVTKWVLDETNMDDVNIGWLDPEIRRPPLSWVEYRGTRLEV
ncbi:MAG: heparinase II/III family protein [Anaerolineales bacterium]|nr:heparinase II/III family protein [Anaerolineales bacterium]